MGGADITLLVVWAGFAVAACQVSLHLYKDLGVLVASQSFVMTLAALTSSQLIRFGYDPAVGLLAAMAVGMGLGLLHAPLLLMVGPSLILVITAVAQIVLSQFWLAIPSWTGGSGGMLVPKGDLVLELSSFGVLLCLGSWYIFRIAAGKARLFDFACIRSLGTKAGALGVTSRRLLFVGFLLYGVTLGACGATAVRLLGFLTPELFGLAWALTTVLITVIAKESRFPLFTIVVLAGLYAGIRVGLRQLVMASPAWSHGYDVLFPSALLVFVAVEAVRSRKRDCSETLKP